MSDYKQYRKAVNISNKDIINVLREKYPQFSKIHCSYINNHSEHGLQLSKEAELMLARKFGFAPGLDVKPQKNREVKRTKSHRLAVRLDDQSYHMVMEKMRQEGCVSVQSFLEKILKGE